MNAFRFISFPLLALAASIAVGCGPDKPEEKPVVAKSAGAVTGLQQTRADLVKGKEKITQATAAAVALQTAQGDLRPAYGQLDKQIKEVEAEAARIRAKNADMRKRADAYQAQWKKDAAAMQNPTLRAAATQRAAGVKERYYQIQRLSDNVRSSYEPFIGDLKDLRSYVANDMTVAAVQSAGPIFDKVKGNGKTLESNFDALIKELDEMAASMAPATAAPAPAK